MTGVGDGTYRQPVDMPRSVAAKLRRAGTHLDKLLDGGGIRIDWRLVSNDEMTEHAMIPTTIDDDHLETVSLVFGDAIQCLRTALDHLVYAIAEHESQQSPPPNPDRLMFPIANPPRTAANMARVDSLSDDAQRAIEREQPTEGTRDTHALWWLDQLNRVDKHRVLRLHQMLMTKITTPIRNVEGTDLHARIHRKQPVTVGMPVVTFYTSAPTPNFEIDWEPDTVFFDLVVEMINGVDNTLVAFLAEWLEAETKLAIERVLAAV